jgi:glycosyltransferase involved in cell wall biosynthesis
MKVLFNYSGMDVLRFGGVSLYAYELIRHFPSSIQTVLSLSVSMNIHFQQWPGVQSPPSFLGKKGLLPDRLRNALCWRYARFFNRRLLLDKLREKDGYDLFHVTWDLEERFFSYLNDRPFVFTIHDLIPEIYGTEKNAFTGRRQWLAEHASRVIAVSGNTKCDAIRVWRLPEGKIDVVYHAPSVPPYKNRTHRVLSERPYILYVGTRGGYKNFEWFVNALSPLMEQRPALDLVCTGYAFSRSEKSLMSRLGIRHKTCVRFVESDHFAALYGAAAIFVYPSLYEGFGMPIVDAFQAGCPVLLSRCSCFPEIGGDAALYFDPDDAESLRIQITRCLDDAVLQETLITRGKERVKAFSWAKAARETCGVYERVLVDCGAGDFWF